MTYTFAELEVSPATYDEVLRLLQAAGCRYAVMEGGAIDMGGIGLTRGSNTCTGMRDRLHSHADDPKAWVGVDFDGTLAVYDHYVAFDNLGPPIPTMVERVRRWLDQGITVKVVTARLHDYGERYCKLSARWYTRLDVQRAIARWCITHIGKELEVTCCKDEHMVELWDDRAVQVVTNTGRTLAEEHEAERAALAGAP